MLLGQPKTGSDSIRKFALVVSAGVSVADLQIRRGELDRKALYSAQHGERTRRRRIRFPYCPRRGQTATPRSAFLFSVNSFGMPAGDATRTAVMIPRTWQKSV